MKVYIILILSLFLLLDKIIKKNEDQSPKIIENEDQCLKRPNMDSDEPFYFAPVHRAKLINEGDQFSFP